MIYYMRFSCLLVLLTTLLWMSPLSLAQSEPLEIENEFLKIRVNSGPEDLGRFAIETVEGDPENNHDNNQLLIYGRPVPWSSYTSFKLNDKTYIFGGKSQKTTKRLREKVQFSTLIDQVISANEILTQAQVGPLKITQSLSFFRSNTTRVKDSVLISYTLLNTSASQKTADMRVMLDTKLGSNDASPFRIGTKEITSELSLKKTELATFWQTFDTLSSPNIIAQGTLSLSEQDITPPDKLVLSNWGNMIEHPFTLPYQEGRSFIRKGETEKDTALALFWNDIILQPNESRTIQTLYGLGGISLSPGELSLGLTSDKGISLSSKESVMLLGYLYNSGGFDARQVDAQFLLPQDFTLVEGNLLTTYNTVLASETKQVPLKIKLSPTARPGKKTVTFTASSSTLEPNRITRIIEIFTPPTLKSNIKVQHHSQSSTHDYSQATLTLENTSKRKIENITATLKLPKKSQLLPIEDAVKYIEDMFPSQKKQVHWIIKSPINNIKPTPLTITIRSKQTQAQTLQNNILIPHTPSVYRLSSSLKKYSLSDYFYISVTIPKQNKNKEDLLHLEYDPSSVSYIRCSSNLNLPLNPILKTKDNTKKNITIQLPEIKKSADHFKLHFKIRKHTKTKMTLFVNTKKKAELPLLLSIKK